MTFISLGFFAFLIISALLFYICPMKFRWIMLLGISVVFYAISGVEYLPFIIFTSLSIFLAARKIGDYWNNQNKLTANKELGKEEKKSIKEKFKKKRMAVLALVLIANLAVLSAVKFTKFFIGPINDLIAFLGGEGTFKASMIIVPLGISYYTFSTVGYLLDIYWKRYEHETNYLRFLLYAIYFPHILQGPIERYNKLGFRLKKELRFDAERIMKGIELMIWGYFKKIVIADRLNIFISDAFENPTGNYGLYYLVALIFDVFYIYADFSGCMDIARGVSDIFGIELDKNFNRPFLAQSIPEFWRRWHITLGSWFKDYVYFPVSNSSLVKKLSKKLKKINAPKTLIKIIVTLIPVFVTWLLTGLWHGTGKTYVAWGIYYATLIGFSVCFSDSYQKLLAKLHIRTDTFTWRVLRTVKIFFLFLIGRSLTTPGGLRNTAYVLSSIVFSPNPWIFTTDSFWDLSALDGRGMIVAILSVLLFIGVDILQECLGEKRLRDRLDEENAFLRVVLAAFGIAAIMIFGIYGGEYDSSAFVYVAF